MWTKRLITLAVAACLTLGAFSRAEAIEVNFRGQMMHQFGFRDNYAPGAGNPLFNDGESDHFFARQRARIFAEFTASENLKGIIQMQFGTMDWGRDGAELDANTRSATIRYAYLDWTIPGSGLNLKVGVQNMALPYSVAGNPVLNAPVAGITASFDITDQFNLAGFWGRPFADDSVTTKNNQMDIFGLALGMDFESFSITPYLGYGRIGEDSGYWSSANRTPIFSSGDDLYANLFLGGVSVSLTPTDDLLLAFDGIYTYLKNEGHNAGDALDKAQGWFLAAKAEYSTAWGTPGVIAWYGSGDDENDAAKGKFGRIAAVGNNNSGFQPARLGFGGAFAHGDDNLINRTGAGMWGAGVYVRDLTFVEKLSHTARFVFFNGTNEKNAAGPRYANENVYLTEKDYGFEIDLDTKWRFTDNLQAVLEMAYIYLDMDEGKNPWAGGRANGFNEDYVWNVQVTLDYKF